MSSASVMFSVKRYLKTGSFKTAHSDYSQRFGCPVPANSVKQFRQTGNVNISKCVRRLAVVTESVQSRLVRDWLQVRTSDCENLQNKVHCPIVAVGKQRRHCSCFCTKLLLDWNMTLLWVVVCKGGGWPSQVRRNLCLRWGVVPSCRLCEHSEYSHMVDGKSPCSAYNCRPPCKDWSMVCSVLP
jgi:hypothetical protein